MYQQNIGSNPVRDKYWREKTDSEKLEVVSELLAQAWRTIRALTERLDDMATHAHHPHTGHVMVTPRDQYSIATLGPPGYCHEDFMLGRAPREHYESPAVTPSGWAGEAVAAGAMPPPQLAPAPATGPENAPEATPGLADPDWPQPAPNPQFHPTPGYREDGGA
jgi:hypothetical protein